MDKFERLGEGVMRSDTYLKTLFENGDKPTEDDFADLIESKAHKKEVFLKKDEVTNEEIDMLIEQLLNSSSDDTNKTFVMVEPTTNNKETNSSNNTKSVTKDIISSNAKGNTKGIPNSNTKDNTNNKPNINMKAIKKPNTMNNNNFRNFKNNSFKSHGNSFNGNAGKKIRARIKK